MHQYSSTRTLFFTLTLILFYLSSALTCSAQDATSKEVNRVVENTTKHPEQPLRIAVASNFTPALKKLLVEFHQLTSIKTQIISGATGAMFIQIQHGAPFDIFIAADSLRPKQLELEGLIVANSRRTYAQGQLALLAMNKTPQLDDLLSIPSRFAIANPDTAPYGKAAKQTLEYLGLWQQYQPKLIVGMNINQTFSQVRSQAVSSGLIANSQLVLSNLTGVIIPENYHQPIIQQLVILKNSSQINQAKRLSDYLLAPSTQQQIIRFGYAKIEQH
jgi:molybdate transport system substrate-binding protein